MATTWRTRLLTELAAPINGVTMQALTYWARSEGMPTSAHNWLATSLKANGWVPPTPPYDEPFYPVFATGVFAIATALKENAYGYPSILQALRQGGSLEAIWAAVNASTWCRGCSGGTYPKVLYENLSAPVTLNLRIQPQTVTYSNPPTEWTQTIVNGTWTALSNWVNIFAQDVQQEILQAQAIFNSI